MEQCSEDNFVRCCGASESKSVGDVEEKTTTDSYETTTFEIPITTTNNQPESRYNSKEFFLVYPEVETPETTTTTEITTTEVQTTEIPTTESSMLIIIPEIKTVAEQQQNRRKIRRRFKPQSKADFIVTTVTPELTSFTPKKDENREISRNKVQQTYRRRTQTKPTTIQPASTNFSKSSKRPIFDASRRANFFSRTKPKSTSIENEEEEAEVIVKILPPQVDSVLQEKVDQEHRIMIEHVRSALSSRSLKNNFEIAQSNMPEIQIKELEAMEKMIQNLLMDLVKEISTEKPKTKINRGRKKYDAITTTTTESTIDQENKPIKTKRRRMRITTKPTTTSTPSSIIQELSTAKTPSRRRTYLTANRKMRVLNRKTTSTTTTEEPIPETTTTTEQITEIPENITEIQQEIKNSPLIADFKPSPLWTLHSEADEIIYQISGSNRQSRDTFQTPINIESGFVPMIQALNPLNIVGPVPSGFKLQFQDSLIFQLPEINSFTIFKI